MAKILVVDDQRTNRQFLAEVLREAGHEILEAADGVEALKSCRAERPDLIVSDILMPHMDGFELVRHVRNDTIIAHTAVIFYTATFSQKEALGLARSYGVEHLLDKSSDPEPIVKTVNEVLQQGRHANASALITDFRSQHMILLADTLTQKVQEVERANQQLAEIYDVTLEGWVRALDLRDKETEGHTQRVTRMTVRLGHALGYGPPDVIDLRRGALLHDIGKIGIPDAILLKQSALSVDEWDVMRRHPAYALKMLAPISFLGGALDIPYCHHEKWDGSGYPRGLRAERIPLAARIFAVVDVWDALSFDRPYRLAWPREKVSAYLREQSGTHFEPGIVERFMSVVERSEV